MAAQNCSVSRKHAAMRPWTQQELLVETSTAEAPEHMAVLGLAVGTTPLNICLTPTTFQRESISSYCRNGCYPLTKLGAQPTVIEGVKRS